VSHWLPLLLQAQNAIDKLSLFFFTNPTVSMRLIEDSHLKAAFSAVGVTLPSRTTLSGTLLDKQYTAAMDKVLRTSFGGVLDAVADGEGDTAGIDMYGLGTLPILASSFAMASDGWRKKACAQGVPLINLMAIPHQEPAVFLKVCAEMQQQESHITRLLLSCLASRSIRSVLFTSGVETDQPPSGIMSCAEQHGLLKRVGGMDRRWLLLGLISAALLRAGGHRCGCGEGC
jgi:hypothetical protein